MLNEELDDKERQYSERRRVESGKKRRLVRKTIKSGAGAGEDRHRAGARRVGDPRECLNCSTQNSGAGKQLEAATQSEGKTMRLLRNKVTDAEIRRSAGALDRYSGCQNAGRRTKTVAYGTRVGAVRSGRTKLKRYSTRFAVAVLAVRSEPSDWFFLFLADRGRQNRTV